MTAAVIGAGAWGTALAALLAENGHATTIWAHEPDVADGIARSHENARFLPGVTLPVTLKASFNLDEALAEADVVVAAAPSHVLRAVLAAAAPHVKEGATIVVASKGIERATLALMSDVAAACLPGRPIVAFSGPSFAAEVAAGQPTAIVAASVDADAATRVQQAFRSPSFRVYTHDDVTGVELGGSLKNVMAVATGIADGLQLGFNARAALITRGLAEMQRLATRMGARPATLSGLAGIGDLVLTCTGSLSRNRTIGLEIGRGKTLSEALAGRETVAEGVTTTESAHMLAQREGVDMPIVAAVHRILFERQPARWALVELMGRELRGEED
ncbi:MAG: NAD(P)-dependent glycerol-3-phosphate dehydrogenase [Gemmatimonadetes bacterium]|nr:NAD(P)-dependent glycerol-3-phosphate dehydrogenase [Gemmatimonadota bacterium]